LRTTVRLETEKKKRWEPTLAGGSSDRVLQGNEHAFRKKDRVESLTLLAGIEWKWNMHEQVAA
jgi:hypothetical protein